MKRLVYYPGFEVSDVNWLKFALLYLDKLEPIIPHSCDDSLSTLFSRLSNETDLIQVHRPKYTEGEKATYDALDVIEKILEHPERFTEMRSIFRLSQWKNPLSHTYTLFQDKYTSSWEDFCISNELATQTHHGLKMSEDLAYIYMALLAQAVADSRELSPITDRPRLDLLSVLSRRVVAPTSKRIDLAKCVLELKLPANISRISIDEVIKFRNKRGFKERLNAFHEELEGFYDKLEDGKTATDFVKSFSGIYSEFTGEILKLGFGTVGIGLGVWILVSSENSTPIKYTKEMLSGLALVVGSTMSIKKAWKNTKTKRYCRKYLAHLRRTNPSIID